MIFNQSRKGDRNFNLLLWVPKRKDLRVHNESRVVHGPVSQRVETEFIRSDEDSLEQTLKVSTLARGGKVPRSPRSSLASVWKTRNWFMQWYWTGIIVLKRLSRFCVCACVRERVRVWVWMSVGPVRVKMFECVCSTIQSYMYSALGNYCVYIFIICKMWDSCLLCLMYRCRSLYADFVHICLDTYVPWIFLLIYLHICWGVILFQL